MSLTDRTAERCAKVSALIYSGQYEQASEIWGSWWYGVGQQPSVDEYPLERGGEEMAKESSARLSGQWKPTKSLRGRLRTWFLLFPSRSLLNLAD
jgi:hypothetical protein